MNVDAYELNKMAGATLFALLVFFGARTASDIIIRAPAPETPGYDVAVTEPEAEAPATAEAEKTIPLAQLLQEASADRGADQARKCVACHTFEQGGANKIGPNLYNVIGRDIASVDGFAYSPALQNMEGAWDYEKLSAFIADPKGFAQGTKMAFAGIRSAAQRADLLMYLREQAPQPAPLPEAPAAQDKAAPADQAPQAATQPQAEPQTQQAPQQQQATPDAAASQPATGGQAQQAEPAPAPEPSAGEAQQAPAEPVQPAAPPQQGAY